MSIERTIPKGMLFIKNSRVKELLILTIIGLLASARQAALNTSTPQHFYTYEIDMSVLIHPLKL